MPLMIIGTQLNVGKKLQKLRQRPRQSVSQPTAHLDTLEDPTGVAPLDNLNFSSIVPKIAIRGLRGEGIARYQSLH